jgi:hypothetical protein
VYERRRRGEIGGGERGEKVGKEKKCGLVLYIYARLPLAQQYGGAPVVIFLNCFYQNLKI